MRVRVTVPEEHVSPAVVNAVLEGVTRLDEQLIRSGQSPTSHELIARGAKWRPEPPGDEHFDNGQTLAQRGWGDCDDWAPLHAATLRTSGTDPGASAIVIPSGPDTYHAVVQRSDGSIDDPSIAAGMKPIKQSRVSGPGEGGEHGQIEILACDPHDPTRVYSGSLLPTTSPMSLHCGPQFAVRKVNPTLFEGRCDTPLAGCAMAPVRSRGVSGAALPYAVSHTAYAPHPGHAICHAVTGALQTADACGCAAPEDYAKMLALQGMLCGASPQEMHAQMTPWCGPEQAHAAVIGAMRIAKRFRHPRHRRRHVRGVAHAAVRASSW